MESFDAADLRMRVRGAFSGSELRRLLESWGARPEEFEAEVSTTTLAHNLVKLGCRLYGARELVRRLSNEKPLVEWPELANDDERWAGPMSAPISLPAASLEAPPTIVMDAPPEAMPAAPSPTLLDATPAPEPAIEASPPSAQAPLSAAFMPGQPSSFSPSPTPEKRVPYLAIGGIAFGLLGVAFGVGILVARPAPTVEPASSDVPTAPERPVRGKSPARRAAGLVEHALVELGSLCEVDVDGALNADVITLSLEACGRDEVEKLRRLREKEMLLSRNDDRDPIPTNGSAQLPIVRQPGGPAPKAPPDRTPQPQKAGCRGQCSQGRASCQNDCGAEPTDAARYGAYQSCISRCVSDESRCRLGCR